MGWYQFRDIQPDEFFVVFADTSEGASDYCAAQFLSTKWLDVPIVFHQKVTASYMTPLIHERLTGIARETGVSPVVAFERNNGGGFEMDRLARLNRYGDYRIYTMKDVSPTGRVVDTGKFGWNTNTATRPQMMIGLKDAIEGRMLHLYHRQTVTEMFSFIINANGKPVAEDKAHDDLIMALAGAWQLYQTERPMLNDGGSNVVETMPLSMQGKVAGIVNAEMRE